MLEVGRYGPVWHSGTSLTGLKPHHHFFLTTVIHRNSFVATERVFCSQNITHMRLQPGPRHGPAGETYSVLPDSGWGRKIGRDESGKGERGKGKRRGRVKEREGNRSIPHFFFPTSSPKKSQPHMSQFLFIIFI